MSKRKEIDQLLHENSFLRHKVDELEKRLGREYSENPKPFIRKAILNRIEDYYYRLNLGYGIEKGFFELIKLLIEINRIDFTDANTVPVIGSQEERET